jgi:hypothetical protein
VSIRRGRAGVNLTPAQRVTGESRSASSCLSERSAQSRARGAVGRAFPRPPRLAWECQPYSTFPCLNAKTLGRGHAGSHNAGAAGVGMPALQTSYQAKR